MKLMNNATKLLCSEEYKVINILSYFSNQIRNLFYCDVYKSRSVVNNHAF